MTTDLRNDVTEIVLAGLREAQAQGNLPEAEVDDAVVERPNNPEHGYLSSTLPLKLARQMRMNPMAIAEQIAEQIPSRGAFERVWAARPGFINFSMGATWFQDQVAAVIAQGDRFGHSDVGAQRKVQVEFVSVNPTGPLHVGHARGAVIGSALAKILDAAGYDVQREYYVNDAGNQIKLFHRSLYARYLQLHGRDEPLPEDGYQGEYMSDLASAIDDGRDEDYLALAPEDAVIGIGKIGVKRMIDSIREDLNRLGVEYDLWFSEQSLFDSGRYVRAMQIIGEGGYIEERDGAVWFASTALGEDKDNVLVKSDGSHTYFASDIAYHHDKFEGRGFERVVNIWGADHQGHVSRMKTAVQALGFDPDYLTMVLCQMVSFKQGGELVRASKRSGNIITISELVDEVGVDACRFFFLSRAAETQMEFDLELAKRESSDNPVYYVQYAHARIAGILTKAAEQGIDHSQADLSLLIHEAELDLIRKMTVLPELVEMMAENLEPHHLPHYAQELAGAFHWFYQQCRVVSGIEGEEALTRARLKLCEAAKTVLANCLDLMGMSAPEQM
ncbi:MAG: arginine--tRNA ligase [SAR202 cluster bacterium]|jgi:arginyl-tRNA synthetase|nr:arginine--tRNA ligase [SAR202 cluster bacterium]MDP6301452.1 arginine--tRNA ligase [SAR202 cluster bacterium]MDP7103832.1 arginine--tRNA ligase [SAR202 cluster bacterium]MDP7225346.1 arginine--tRNA ligase [SAR202 cluster bacterium]MDP7413519.1 arginine--tRNA ligase [SAR202 cluster bacterium]|tara:strand:- start:4146 stop:5822 length:1677 start_codon:yes stop_codon:yes gene_type:complete